MRRKYFVLTDLEILNVLPCHIIWNLLNFKNVQIICISNDDTKCHFRTWLNGDMCVKTNDKTETAEVTARDRLCE